MPPSPAPNATARPDAFADALELALLADDAAACLKLAQGAGAKFSSPDSELVGLLALGFWRAGRLSDAERVADTIDPDSSDRASVEALLRINLGRGELAQAAEAANELAQVGPLTGPGYGAMISARLAQDQHVGLGQLLQQAQTNARRAGFLYTADDLSTLSAIAKLLDTVQDEPLNHVIAHGRAAMPMNPILHLPTCQVRLNGKGPFRLILDSGAGDSMFLSTPVAEEIKLKSVSDSEGCGFGGRVEIGHAIVEEVTIGEIVCRCVQTSMPRETSPLLTFCEGVLGTGVFGDARVRMDFEHGWLDVLPASDQPEDGFEQPFRAVGNLHTVTCVKLRGQPAVALLDTGAEVPLLSTDWLRKTFPDDEFAEWPLPMFGFGAGARIAAASHRRRA